MRISLSIPLAIVLLSLSFAAAPLPRERVDQFVSPAMRLGGIQGCVVGLIDANGRAVFGYGSVRENGPAPDGQTVFEIGSVTKCFTGLLLAQMAEAGEVTLDEPVSQLLPEGVAVPSKDGASITLLHLSAQTSGLPRMPPNFDPADVTDPYADYDAQKLYDALRAIELSRRPGERYDYSNLGVGLLGHALALRAGRSYEQLLIERICAPLGLRDTRLTLDADQRRRFATGHDIAGAASKPWAFDAFAGAGAIRSTADDMLAFLAANLALVESPLSGATKTTHAPRARADSDRTDIGLGWHIGTRTGARWHNGQTGGYHSFVAFVPGRQVGVVVLTNASGGIIDTLGTQLLQLMLGEAVEPLQLPKPMTPQATTTTRASNR